MFNLIIVLVLNLSSFSLSLSLVYSDGSQLLLVCLYGTVPIIFRSQQYHIPVKIWLPRTYPFTAPYVFVDPTESMICSAFQDC